VTHSLVDCVLWPSRPRSASSSTTGDFKIDLSPLDEKAFDLHTFAEYGKRGVLALLQDSTNVERSGYTPSERAGHSPPRRDLFADKEEAVLYLLSHRPSIACASPMELARAHAAKWPS